MKKKIDGSFKRHQLVKKKRNPTGAYNTRSKDIAKLRGLVDWTVEDVIGEQRRGFLRAIPLLLPDHKQMGFHHFTEHVLVPRHLSKRTKNKISINKKRSPQRPSPGRILQTPTRDGRCRGGGRIGGGAAHCYRSSRRRERGQNNRTPSSDQGGRCWARADPGSKSRSCPSPAQLAWPIPRGSHRN